MTVQEFYKYCKKNNILDYYIEIHGDYFYDSIRCEDEDDERFPKNATVDNERKIIWVDVDD